jgi:hypothetical protein
MQMQTKTVKGKLKVKQKLMHLNSVRQMRLLMSSETEKHLDLQMRLQMSLD